MKTSKILLAIAIPALAVSCSKQELPYDLDETVHTFAISTSKDTQHDLLLAAGTTDGDYVVKLSVPEYMGDYKSFFQEAELVCVFTPASGDTTYAKVVKTGITELPASVTIDMATTCQELGISAPSIGDKMQFTANIIHKDGTFVPGWTKEMGFNFRNPTFYSISYCATFTAAAPLQLEYYAGGNTVSLTQLDDMYTGEYVDGCPVSVALLPSIEEEVISEGFTAEDYIGLELTYDWYCYGQLVKQRIYINKKDYSVSSPADYKAADTDDTWIYEVYMGYGPAGWIEFYNFSGELDTQTNVLTFSMNVYWNITAGAYSGMGLNFGSDVYQIDFSAVIP